MPCLNSLQCFKLDECDLGDDLSAIVWGSSVRHCNVIKTGSSILCKL